MKFLFALFFSQMTWAQVLLVPDSKIDFEKYKSHCTKDGYLCTMPFLLQQAQQADSKKFDDLLNQLDYSSQAFRSEFLSNFYSILKNDSLSIEQAEMLLKILQQLNQFQTQETQLIELIKLVKTSEITELPAHYQIVLKKPVSEDFKKNWRPEFFKVKILNVEFNKTIENQALVEGECENARLHASLQNLKWQIDADKLCGFGEHLAVVTEKIVEHKTGLLTTGLVLVGAAVLFNQYEVKFTF